MALRLSAILLAVVCAAGCGRGGSYSTMSPSVTPDPAPAGSTTVTIPSGAASQTTGAYMPNPLTVSTGTTVSFLNSDSTSHTSTADAGAWNSSTLAPGKRFNVTLQTAGRFTYHCGIHPNMVGTITVQ
jgi:plastocyanin